MGGLLESFIGGMADSAVSRWEREAEEMKAQRLEKVRQKNRINMQDRRNSGRLANTALQGKMRENAPSARMKDAAAGGLKPGTSQYREFMLRQGTQVSSPTARMKNARALGLKRGSPEYNRMIGSGRSGEDIRVIDGTPVRIDPHTGTFAPLDPMESLFEQEARIANQLSSDERAQAATRPGAQVSVGMPQVVPGGSNGAFERVPTGTSPEYAQTAALIRQARQAIQQGASRSDVERRLLQAGLKPGQIKLSLGKLGR
jgi:hypothetical protein